MAAQRVPFVILTGWLGAGKTTALNRMLAAAGGKRIAVLVNELGRIAIDTRLIIGGGGDVLELAGGCVCCKVDLKNDLWDGIVDIVGRSRPDCVVLETTGIAEPAVILDGLARPISRPLREERGDAAIDVVEPAGVVCVVDADAGGRVFEERESARRQLAIADRVMIAKLDVASAAAARECHAAIDRWAPDAERASFPDGAAGARAMAAWMTERRAVRGFGERADGQGDGPGGRGDGHRGHGGHGDGGHAHAPHAAHGQLVAYAFTDDVPLVGERVLAVLDQLGDRLVRAKGFVQIAGDDRRAFVERAGIRTTLTWAEPWPAGSARTSELVLIGDDLDEPALQRALWACRAAR